MKALEGMKQHVSTNYIATPTTAASHLDETRNTTDAHSSVTPKAIGCSKHTREARVRYSRRGTMVPPCCGHSIGHKGSCAVESTDSTCSVVCFHHRATSERVCDTQSAYIILAVV